MVEITLRIQDKIFKVNKELLCEYSDYFRAMFSGNYVESEKQEIIIDMLDPDTMGIILKYMQMGMILLSEYPLSIISDIAIAANFLQIIELIKQIEYVLNIQLSESNWMETMAIAQSASFAQLEQFSSSYGLYSFKSMKPEYIPTISKLVWYLSHPYLGSESEIDVFQFGLKWILDNNKLDDTLPLILACLDFKRLSNDELKQIQQSLNGTHFSNSLAIKIIDCLLELTDKHLEISESVLCKNRTEISVQFTDKVWCESLSIVKNSRTRVFNYVPVLPIWMLKDCKPEFLPHHLYTFEEDKGFEQYLKVADKNIWGWNVASWGVTKLVIVNGEHGRGSGIFMRDVKVYDTLRKEWTHHGVQLPQRRHAGVTILGDLMYIIGGIGEFRVILETTIEYDLKQRTYRKIAKLPDAVQNPAVCTFKNNVYAAGQTNIYSYESLHDKDCWETSVATEMRMSCLRQYKNYIYCMQSYFRNFYRYRPGIDEKLDLITNFTNLPATICNLGNRLMIFTRNEYGLISVEEYRGEDIHEKPKVLAVLTEDRRVNDVAGSCSMVMTMPPLCTELSEYHTEFIATRSLTVNITGIHNISISKLINNVKQRT